MRQHRVRMDKFRHHLPIWLLGALLGACGIDQMFSADKSTHYNAYLTPQVGLGQEFVILEDTSLSFQANPIQENPLLDENSFRQWQERLRYHLVTPPRFGTVERCFEVGSECEYRPQANFYGEDRLEYQVQDGPNSSQHSGVITIQVTPVNDPPIPGRPQIINGSNAATVTFTLNPATDPDNSPQELQYHLAGDLGTNGTLSGCLDGTSSLQCQYHLPPNQNQISFDFQYRVFDGASWSLENGQISIQVGPDNTGCTDPLADNYNLAAAQDDGSCQYTCLPGNRYEETQEYRVDMLQKKINLFFAIDTSSSMSNEITNVKQNIAHFASTLRGSLPQSKIVMMGTRLLNNYILPNDYPQNGFQNGIYWHFHYLGSSNKMRSVADTLELLNKTTSLPFNEMFFKTPSERVVELPEYPLFIRQSFTHFIFITDDTEDTYDLGINQVRLESFRQRMNNLLGPNQSDYTIHAIHTQENFDQYCRAAANRRYHLPYVQAARETGGLSLNLCHQDWSELFAQIKNQVVASASALYLQQCSHTSKTLEKVQVSCGSINLSLNSSEYQFMNATSLRPGYLIIDPQVLANKGCALSSPINITVNYRI